MKLLRVKTENLLALLYLPIGIINITKAKVVCLPGGNTYGPFYRNKK